RSRVRQYLNPTATPLTPETIEKIRDAHAKQIPNRKHIIYSNYRIGGEGYDNIPEILPEYNLSNTRNTEQVISLSKPMTKKTSRKKKILQNEELSSSNIDKTNSGMKLSKGEDRSESKIINHSTSSIPESDAQTKMENL
ncbi:5170_t:CDS:2, partial [Gigaspora margarita]